MSELLVRSVMRHAAVASKVIRHALSLALVSVAAILGLVAVRHAHQDVDGAIAVVDPADQGADGALAAAAPYEDWQSKVFSRLEQQEYFASQQDGGLQAPNRAQNLRTHFRAGGVDVVPRDANAREAARWQFAWRTSQWGRAGQLATVSEAGAPPRANGARVTYAHDGLDEWYENKKEGLEQGFTVHERPAGDGPLVVRGRIDGGLHPSLSPTDGAIDLLDEHGARVLRYGELHVWDAGGQEIASHLETNGLEIAIVIDDAGADYPLTIDPLLTSPSWTAVGGQAGALLGISVATAGDVNGDGFSDVIVGAFQYDNGHSNEGAAFVYHGSANGLSIDPSWTAEGNELGALFGNAVAAAGDINGDGFGDVIVGAPESDNGPTVFEGRAFVFCGSSSGLSPNPNWIGESNQSSTDYGFSVATAGDVNGDGFADVIVGAQHFDAPEGEEGRAFVYHGSASGLSLNADWTGESNQVGAQLGGAVATAGDVNGDGFGDVIVGAPWYDNGQTSEGRAYVYHGSASGLSIPANWIGEGNLNSAVYGVSVAGAGDVNGDGFGDVIVGAQGYNGGQPGEGRAFVYHGSATGLLPLAWTAESNQDNASFGHSVATAGDVNGDGFADVIIGANNYGNGQVGEGRAYVYQGSGAGLVASPMWTTESNQPGAGFGISVSTAGDVNGDGFSDVIVGAWAYANEQPNEGGAFVYHGAPGTLATTAAWTAELNQDFAVFGASVASAGDVNGDGYSDVIVGAPFFDNGENDEGRAYVFHGSLTGLSTAAAWIAESNKPSAWFGFSVATAGDVNGDGFSDVVVGARSYTNGQSNEGAAFLYHGSAGGLSLSPDWMVEGNRDSDQFGYSVGTAGDVNGDGFSDVIVGAASYTSGEILEGRALVYHGSAGGLATSPAWTADGNQPFAHLGISVATAGDVNGDGFSDIIVGASGYDNDENAEGRAFVYNGSASGLGSTASWTAESNQTSSNFGISVAGAGDVNGDGYSDVIVGASLYDNGETDEGRAFVYHGSAGGLSLSANWTAESDQENPDFGYSVAAGDVNGDGFSDVLVGAQIFDGVQIDEGWVFFYPGSAIGLSPVPRSSEEGNQDSAYFGCSVATGDVNGDGFSDVLVGSYAFDDGQPNEGRAFVYYGNERDGLDLIPRQARTDDTALISLLGASDSPSAFLLKARGRTAAGRGRVRLQYEVKPLGDPFNGAGLVIGNVLDTGTPVLGTGSAVAITELVSGLGAESVYKWRLRILSDSPFFPHSRWLSHPGNALTETDLRTAGSELTGVGDALQSAHESWLEPCAPNPFTTETRVRFALPERGRVRLAIYDVSGRKVAALTDEVREAGSYSQPWDGRGSHGERVPSGVYFARLEFGGRVEARKVVLTR